MILGLDIGGTTTTACLGRPTGEVLHSCTVASKAGGGFHSVWASVLAAAGTVLDSGSGHPDPRCVGVSVGGPVDHTTGVVYSPPNLPGWQELPLQDLLTEHFALPVYVEHDAKAGALAEWMYGAGRGVQNLIFLTLGTGLGAGVIVDGRLLHGRRDNLGEVGHWRMAHEGPTAYGKAGSWEGFSSGAGLAAGARRLDPVRWSADTKGADVVQAARDGDPGAYALLQDFTEKLGSGIALLVDLLAPEIVVLGSLAVRAGDLFLPQVQAIVDRECTTRNLPCPVVAAGLGEQIGMCAALAVAARRSDTQISG